MNHFKQIYSLLFVLVISTACHENNSLNQREATIEFQSTEIRIKELTTSLQIPIVVKGEHDGLIKVRIALTENHSGYENDKDILITDTQLLIPATTSQVNVETLLSVANEEISLNRYFTLTITDAEGASIGTQRNCKIVLQENSPIEGKYMMEGKSQLQSPNGITSYACTLASIDDSFRQMSLDFGQGGAALAEVEPTGTEGEYKLTIHASQFIGNYGGNRVELTHKMISGGRWIKTSESIIGTFKNRIITFETGHALGMEIPAIEGWLGLVGSYTDNNGKNIPLKLIKQ